MHKLIISIYTGIIFLIYVLLLTYMNLLFLQIEITHFIDRGNNFASRFPQNCGKDIYQLVQIRNGKYIRISCDNLCIFRIVQFVEYLWTTPSLNSAFDALSLWIFTITGIVKNHAVGIVLSFYFSYFFLSYCWQNSFIAYQIKRIHWHLFVSYT